MTGWQAWSLEEPASDFSVRVPGDIHLDCNADLRRPVHQVAGGPAGVNIPKATLIVAGPPMHGLKVIDAGGESQTVLQGNITVIRTLNPAT